MFQKSFLVVVLFVLHTYSSTFGKVDITCKIDSVQYSATIAMSGSSFGSRMDLKPVGAIVAPWPVPTCPQCGFPHFEDTLTSETIKRYRKFVTSETFKEALTNKESSYYRVALISEFDSLENVTVGYHFLQGSWQVENDRQRYKKYLKKSLYYYKRALQNDSLGHEDSLSTRLTIGEIMRLLGQFEEAKKHFVSMKEEVKEFPYRPLIAFELSLIKKKNRKQQMVPSLEKTEEDIKAEPAYKMMEASPELMAFHKMYSVYGIRAKDGYAHGSSIDGMEQWSAMFTPLTKFDFPCMASLIFGIDSLDSIHVGLTPQRLDNAFLDVTSSTLFKTCLRKNDRVRIRAEADRLHWDIDVVKVLYDHLIDRYPNLPAKEDWIYMIIDAGKRSKIGGRVYHPMGTDIYIFSGDFNTDGFTVIKDKALEDKKQKGKYPSDYFAVVNNNLEVVFIKKDKKIIESVQYFMF